MSTAIIVFGERLDADATHFLPRPFRGPYDGRELGLLATLPRLKSASLCDVPIDDEGLVHLVEATSIESLTLQSTALSNEGLRSLARLPRLTHLRLKDNPQLDDRCVPHLCALARLTSLQVHETSITTAGLAHLASLPALRDLCVDTETGTFAALRELSLRLPRCEILVKGEGTLVAGRYDGDGTWP
ncbi:MAG: hypothetical protein KC486_13050 [Myxococcales bacterium]|nr:hypothetical protein [Myxococcales bacterium]